MGFVHTVGLPGRRGGGLRGLFVWLEALMQQFKFRC